MPGQDVQANGAVTVTWWPLRPSNVLWPGFTEEQARLLELIDHAGHNGWIRNHQTEELMPQLLAQAQKTGLTLAEVKEAMRSIGYDRHALHMLDRWELERTTGNFDR